MTALANRMRYQYINGDTERQSNVVMSKSICRLRLKGSVKTTSIEMEKMIFLHHEMLRFMPILMHAQTICHLKLQWNPSEKTRKVSH